MRKLKNKQLNRLNLEEFKIRSAYNVGSIFRTSDAFLIEKIILCGITPTPPKNEIRKTALGATESLDWEYYLDSLESIKKLKNNGYTIVSIEQANKSENLKHFKLKNSTKLALVFGNELNGVNDKIINASDKVVEIPQYGTKHSFNVSVSVGIVLWDIFLKKDSKLF